MQTTANYGFKKPDGVETVNIDDLNYNADVADVELKKRALQTDFSSHLADNTAHGIGDRSKLLTTAKDNFVNAINEVFQSGTSVKSNTISAVNSKGQSLSTTSTWDQIIAAINCIARGQGNAVENQVLSGADFSNSDGILRHGSMPNNGTVVLTPTTVNQAIAQGYHPGTGYVKGDTNLVTSNIKSGVSIFGVSGKSSVVETTESANPIAASTVRSGKVGYVNGSKITGSLAVQATAAQTVTPGNSDIVKGAGIYDATITIKGDSNLQSPNILKDKSIFGVIGTAEEKPNKATLLNSLISNNLTMVSSLFADENWFIDNNNKYIAKQYDLNGNVINTVTLNSLYSIYYISKNYILAGNSNVVCLYNKSGTLLQTISRAFDISGAYIDEKNSRIMFVNKSYGWFEIYSLSFSALKQSAIISSGNIVIIPMGDMIFVKNSCSAICSIDVQNNIISGSTFIGRGFEKQYIGYVL
ncbi:hypothetical protein [Clostridium sp. 001]|uniref:hypothetical protein n=1 Tax=Clostridium sp. 001 TaxID=1970093 RepID=UPI001C2C8724|nr:hypothetical protein [Clostridium sp. 001]QXE19550.1 hypothetical protein B5S50_12370 [Clostridium sp. 001]